MGLRIAFLGTPVFAVPTLAEAVRQGHTVAAVYTQPPRPRGRGLDIEASPVAQFSRSRGIEVRAPQSLRNNEAMEAFEALGCDAAVVVAYGLLLPARVLAAPKLGCFNLHASLLPRWRGAAPIQRAIMAGDRETGVMVMRMEEGLDTGPILMTRRVSIDRKTYGELRDELAHDGAELMMDALSSIENGTAEDHAQSNDGATYAKKILKEEARIDWRKPAQEIDNLVRALSPSPGAWCELRGERLKILYAVPADGAGEPGHVLDERLTVACGKDAVRLVRVQRAGRNPAGAEEFLRGFPVLRGEQL